MIKNLKRLRRYCREYTKIKGFDRAMLSPETFVVHHVEGISSHKTIKELKADGMYYHVKPEDLMLITKKEHYDLHKEDRSEKISRGYRAHKINFDETLRKKLSDSKLGKKRPLEYKQKLSGTMALKLSKVKEAYREDNKGLSWNEFQKDFWRNNDNRSRRD